MSAASDTSIDGVLSRVCSYLTPSCGTYALLLAAVAIAFIALLTLHALTLWLSADPQRAFHLARRLVGWYSTAWNSFGDLYNGAIFVGTRFVPAFNVLAKHVVEPTVYISLDVASLVFAQHHYEGMISESSVPFLGHYCGDPATGGKMDGTTAQFCTLRTLDEWAAELGAEPTSDAQAVVDSTNRSKLLLSTAQVRRLAQFLPDDSNGRSIFPHLHLAPLADAVAHLGTALVVLSSTVADVTMHVAYTVLSEIAVLLWNLAQILLKALAQVVMAVIRSGVLQSVLRAGVDLLVVLVVYVALPILLAIIDVFLCAINLIMPSTWAEQLECIERTCFTESGDFGAEIFTTFFSFQIVGRAVSRAVQALINPDTGRKYGASSTGTTDAPNIDAGDDSSGAASTSCGQCFTCRVPELRALWLLVAMTYGCARDESRFGGRVEHQCADGGAWYVEACGPRDTPSVAALSPGAWAATYVKHRNFDGGLVQHYYGAFKQHATDSGGATNALDASAIAEAWRGRDVSPSGRVDQAAPFYRVVCEQMRRSFPSPLFQDAGPSHANFSEGSLADLSAGFLYKACKYDVGFQLCSNPLAMGVVDGWHEVKNCLFDVPTCRRERDLCLGSQPPPVLLLLLILPRVEVATPPFLHILPRVEWTVRWQVGVAGTARR